MLCKCLVLRTGNRLAKAFFLRPFPFGLKPADPRGVRGSRSAARRRYLRSPPDQRDEAIQGIATIPFLGAEPPSIDNKDAVSGNPFAGQTKQTLPNLIGNASRFADVESELNSSLDLVDILSPRAGCSDELLLDLAFIDCYGFSNGNHEYPSNPGYELGSPLRGSSVEHIIARGACNTMMLDP